MDSVQRVFILGPILGAAVGYLVDGVTGAMPGFLIPMELLVMVWLFGTR